MPFAFGAFLALGLSFTLMIQAIANMAVNVNLFPVTGGDITLDQYGWKFIFVYLPGHRYHFKCGEECGKNGGRYKRNCGRKRH